MSELTSYYYYEDRVITPATHQYRVYHADEADKVIAEKDKEIQRLENLCESYRIDCDNLAIREANAYKEIERDNKQLRHHKYKRCLAMAERCKDKIENAVQYDEHDDWLIINEYWERWHERWLKMAKLFKDKEAK